MTGFLIAISISIVLLALAVWWLNRQAVEVEPPRVDHPPFVVVRVPYDWAEHEGAP
jgi:hypothetical protein